MQLLSLYDAAFQLTTGEYRTKVLARENQEGKLGTFDAKFRVPDLDLGNAAAVSSLVLGTGRETLAAVVGSAGTSKKAGNLNLLVVDGKKLAPSVTHVFRRPQTMTVFGETHGRKQIWQSAPLRPAAGRAGAYTVETAVRLGRLQPGEYVCQLTVVDPLAQKFEVRRVALSIVP